MTRLTLRVDLGSERQIGPGKIKLLELIRDRGSISAAGRAMGMSYRRAWLLIDSLNQYFSEPVVTTQLGGKAGGGAGLTAFGAALVGHYRSMEREAAAAVGNRLADIQARLAAAPTKSPNVKSPNVKSVSVKSTGAKRRRR
jgi:molybdate transport system regulatory protein